jgi:serine kinase of HPr protein (carbohydrate metabolism regulator)
MAWITMQTHKNVIAIASLKELACVIIVNNNKPSEDMIEAANNEGIPVIVTELSAFEFSGLLYRELNQ